MNELGPVSISFYFKVHVLNVWNCFDPVKGDSEDLTRRRFPRVFLGTLTPQELELQKKVFLETGFSDYYVARIKVMKEYLRRCFHYKRILENLPTIYH